MGRKDYSKEIKAAEENQKKFKESDEKDKTKKELRELLNILTKDNYEEKKNQILEIIKENVESQKQFLEIFILKAVREKAYGDLYAKLCRFLDIHLPQKTQEKERKKNPSSIFRIKLIKKCREIFKNKNLDKYIKEEEPKEREVKTKKFVLGNINFIAELIKKKLLSIKVMPECIEYLFEKVKNETNSYLKSVHVESIIIFTDKFGTLVNLEKKSMKSEKLKTFKEKLEDIFKKLENLKKDNELPGHIKYLIINLIEKKKNNYKESQYERYVKAKSKKELEEQLKKNKKNEKEQELEQEEINEKIKNDLNEYKDFIEEEGNSEKYSWRIITELYDEKSIPFDDILEGYITSCGDFID